MAASSGEPMISYAQNREDVLLERVFRETREGFYVDVGANDPVVDSVTKHFHDRGWRGINVEPGAVFAKLAAARPNDINLNVAVSDAVGEATFHESVTPNATGVSSLRTDAPEALRAQGFERVARTVPTLTLRAIFERHAPPPIDFMSVDVEGHEREVLAGNDWSRWRPRVLIVEATLPLTNTPCHERWEDVVLAADYRFAHFDGINRWYVRGEDAALLGRLAAPVNVLDHYVTAETARLRRLEAAIGHAGGRSLQIGLVVTRLVHRVYMALARRG